MNNNIVIFILLPLIFSPASSLAVVKIEGDSEFSNKVEAYLNNGKNMSSHLEKLINAVENTSVVVTIAPITDDKSTWHSAGKKSRSHTEANDGKDRGDERNTATDSVIFINTNRIDPNHKSYKNGTLIHEIVHAVDLANGKYNGEYSIRERRAIFFENIWRNGQGEKPRSDYHGRFETKDYQRAISNGSMDNFVTIYFNSNSVAP